MASFFHAYDLRGKHPEEIDVDEAQKVGRSLGTFLNSGAVIVGRDGRTHGRKISDAFIQGVISTGTDVLDAGMVPTPVLYYATVERGLPSAVVTASHNPPEYTGFKFMHSDGSAMSRESGMEQIEKIYTAEEFEATEGGQRADIEVREDYVEWLAERFDAECLSVAVNYGNGVAAEMGPHLFESLGCEHRGVNDEVDGTFPSHLPDPTNKEAQEYLQNRMEGEDLGILIDGDGDRAGFILDGEYVDEDSVLALFAQNILEETKGAVVHDLRASKLVKEVIREAGGEPVESRVGHTFISEEIFERGDVVFAGELSGHYYFPAFEAPFDDGLMAAAFMCELVAGGEAERLKSYPEYPVSPELRIDCPEEAKAPVIERIKQEFSDHPTSTKDGVKVEFEDGWALIRPSNTEPKMSVRCEADDEPALDRILEQVEKAVRNAIEAES